MSAFSKCVPGEEYYEYFGSRTLKKKLIQYDYRRLDGKLFTCIARTLEDARLKRDEWLAEQQAKQAKET